MKPKQITFKLILVLAIFLTACGTSSSYSSADSGSSSDISTPTDQPTDAPQNTPMVDQSTPIDQSNQLQVTPTTSTGSSFQDSDPNVQSNIQYGGDQYVLIGDEQGTVMGDPRQFVVNQKLLLHYYCKYFGPQPFIVGLYAVNFSGSGYDKPMTNADGSPLVEDQNCAGGDAGTTATYDLPSGGQITGYLTVTSTEPWRILVYTLSN